MSAARVFKFVPVPTATFDLTEFAPAVEQLYQVLVTADVGKQTLPWHPLNE